MRAISTDNGHKLPNDNLNNTFRPATHGAPGVL